MMNIYFIINLVFHLISKNVQFDFTNKLYTRVSNDSVHLPLGFLMQICWAWGRVKYICTNQNASVRS